MILARLLIGFVRACVCALLACVAIVLAVAACLGVAAAGIIGLWNEERGHQCHQAAVLLIDSAIKVGRVAEGGHYRTSNVR